MALWVGKERALKPSHQLFINLDQKVCLIPEYRAKWMTYSEDSGTVPPTVGRLFDFIYYLENQDQ